jgi:hypothetical protein
MFEHETAMDERSPAKPPFIPIIVSNCVLPPVVFWGKQAVFYKMDSPFGMRTLLILPWFFACGETK